MAEFVVIGLAIAILAVLWKSPSRMIEDRASSARVVLASILLTSWLPVLLWGIHDLPPGFDWREEFFTPVTLLILTPYIGSWLWYRGTRRRSGWRMLLAPLAIYLSVTAQLITLLMSLKSSVIQKHR